MKKIYLFVFAAVFFPHFLYSQVSPNEGRELNYRIVGFCFPAKPGVTNYEIEIANGSTYSEDSFKRSIFTRQNTSTNKVVTEVPYFAAQYTWRVVYNDNAAKTTTTSPFYHFSTGFCREIDSNYARLQVSKSASKFRDAYVFLDGNNVLYDMMGNPVWYLPLIDGSRFPVTDLKLTAQGTITFIAANRAMEIDYDGNVLWKAPEMFAGEGVKVGYHHEFDRLKNGNYMVLGTENATFVVGDDSIAHLPTPEETGSILPNNPKYPRLQFSKIFEFDKNGNIVWSWSTLQYYKESDLLKYAPTNRYPATDIHENAFNFDEKNGYIYLGFKNISRIVKIKYPEGNVVQTYGEQYTKSQPEKGNGLFCNQHSIRVMHDGNLLVFNNNKCNRGLPSVEKLVAPTNGSQTPVKSWEYKCVSSVNAPVGFTTGGNAFELTDNSLFISMPTPDSKILILSPGKQILWCGYSIKWNADDQKWMPLTQYRASIIENKKQLEQLIWNTTANRNCGAAEILP